MRSLGSNRVAVVKSRPHVRDKKSSGGPYRPSLCFASAKSVLASAASLASIVAPLAFSTFHFVVQKEWPGAIWLSVVVVNAIAVPLVFLAPGPPAPRSLRARSAKRLMKTKSGRRSRKGSDKKTEAQNAPPITWRTIGMVLLRSACLDVMANIRRYGGADPEIRAAAFLKRGVSRASRTLAISGYSASL